MIFATLVIWVRKFPAAPLRCDLPLKCIILGTHELLLFNLIESASSSPSEFLGLVFDRFEYKVWFGEDIIIK